MERSSRDRMVIALEELSEEDKKAFWDLVKVGLLILRADLSLFDKYQEVYKASPVEEQILTYHMCPLNLAADLAGISVPSDEQYKVYIPIEILLLNPEK